MLEVKVNDSEKEDLFVAGNVLKRLKCGNYFLVVREYNKVQLIHLTTKALGTGLWRDYQPVSNIIENDFTIVGAKLKINN